MLKTILSISGKPGLYKLVSQGKNMLIVESLADKKRFPAYGNEKIISLGDIAQRNNLLITIGRETLLVCKRLYNQHIFSLRNKLIQSRFTGNGQNSLQHNIFCFDD